MVVLTMLSFGTSPIAWRAAVAAVALACFLLRLAKVGLYSFPLTLTCLREREKRCVSTSLFVSLSGADRIPF